jgi:hypothetical protein
MKKLRLGLIAFLLLGLLACNNDDSTAPPLSNEEAAEMVATALAEDASGFTVVASEASATTITAVEENASGRVNACGYANTVSFSKTNPAGTVITYSFDYDYSYQMLCSAEQPLQMDVEVFYNGSFDSPRFTSNHLGDMKLSVSALDVNLSNFIFDGSFEQSGSFQSNINNQSAGSCTLQFVLDQVAVSKTTREMTGGTASVSITGEVSGKGTFSFEAVVTFSGSHTATVEIDGITYLVDLIAGTVTQQ